jgi:3-methyladenine DNA glycosylase/8-oxoguanine DNA glycosylase
MTAVAPPGFGFDPRLAVRDLRAADTGLGALIDAVGPFTMELQAAQSTFTALSEAIVYQQLNPKAAATIYGRFRALAGQPAGPPGPDRLMTLTDEELRAAGLSRAKTRAMRDLAERTLAGEIPDLDEARLLPDGELIQRLSAVRGIGRWTAEMFLMFRLGRPDVLPLGDYGLRRGYGIVFAGGQVAGPGEIAERAEAWRPYRTVASWYLWRAAEATPL